MKTLIIYNSVSGFTRKYAELLNEEIEDGEVIALKQFKTKMLKAFDRVIFMSFVTNNSIEGFKIVIKNADLFASKYVTVIAVGMSEDSPSHSYGLEQANIPYSLKGVPLFYLKGGFDADKLTGKNKLMIKFSKSRLMSASSRNPSEMAMLRFLSAKSDYVNKDNLQGVLNFLRGGDYVAPQEPEEYEPISDWVDLSPFMPNIGSETLQTNEPAAQADCACAEGIEAKDKSVAADSEKK